MRHGCDWPPGPVEMRRQLRTAYKTLSGNGGSKRQKQCGDRARIFLGLEFVHQELFCLDLPCGLHEDKAAATGQFWGLEIDMIKWVIAAICSIASCVAYGNERISCVSELRIPEYSSLARQARLIGTAIVRIVSGEEGEARKISVKGVHKLLERAVIDSIHASRFKAECKGQEIQLLFIFELDKPAKQIDAGYVVFRPPNIFVIRAAYFPVSGQATK